MVVTGASSGIGCAIARQLAAEGAELVLAARRRDRLEALARELTDAHGRSVDIVALDLAAPGSAHALFAASTAGGKVVTFLVNNAGVGPYVPFVEAPLALHQQTLHLNVVALTELMHLFATHMLEHGRPSKILNVASVAAYQSAPRFGVYSGTKHYVRALSQVTRYELRDTNVDVSCLCPGGTFTEFTEVAGQQVSTSGQRAMMTADAVVRVALDGVHRNRGIIVPGFLNWLSCVLPRFLPEYLSIAIAGKAMAQAVTPAAPSMRIGPGGASGPT